MIEFATQAFMILLVGSVLGWLSKRTTYTSFIGYVLGVHHHYS